MKADQIASAPAPIQASTTPQRPSATRPSIGAALRFISANNRTIAAEWVGIGSRPIRAWRARRSSRAILRRRTATSGSLGPAAPSCALSSLMIRPARNATRADMLSKCLTRPDEESCGLRIFTEELINVGGRALGGMIEALQFQFRAEPAPRAHFPGREGPVDPADRGGSRQTRAQDGGVLGGQSLPGDPGP